MAGVIVDARTLRNLGRVLRRGSLVLLTALVASGVVAMRGESRTPPRAGGWRVLTAEELE